MISKTRSILNAVIYYTVLSKVRAPYLKKAFPRIASYGHEYWSYIDDYNNNFFCPVIGKMNPNAIDKAIKELAEGFQENLDELAAHRLDNYVNKLWEHEKYSPKNTLGMNPINLLRKEGLLEVLQELTRQLRVLKGIRNPSNDQQNEQRLLKYKINDIVKKAYERKAIRRGCKFGLQMICRQLNATLPNSKVHFLLDAMDMDSVIDNTPATKDMYGQNYQYVYITYTELRSVYRYWDKFDHNKIHFYLNGEDVGPPWKNDWVDKEDVVGVQRTNTADAWGRYIPNRWRNMKLYPTATTIDTI